MRPLGRNGLGPAKPKPLCLVTGVRHGRLERRACLCLELIAVKRTISDDRQGGTVMWHIKAQLDWEMGERAGAGGTFQVIELKDDEENDLTDLVDQGRHFHSIAELKQAVLLAIAGRLEITEAA
jgi:hypothetical protein